MDQTNPVPPMQHIFVSYSRADRETVDVIVAQLKNDGFNVWIDREGIRVGQQWGAEILEAVDKAYAFLLMLSPSAVASKYVNDEVYVAYNGPKELIYVPVKLSPVEIQGDLRLPLARVQYIEYYRDPEAKYAQLVKALHTRRPEPTSKIRAVGLALPSLKPRNLNAARQKQLLDSIANLTGTPRVAVEIAKPIDLNGYLVVKMPAEAAYRLKAAALNRDERLINFGIKGLHLIGDRSFVWVKSGRFGLLEPPKTGSGSSCIGCSALLIALLVSLFIIMIVLGSGVLETLLSTPTPRATNTDTPIPSSTFTATETITFTPSLTQTSTDTITPSPTSTFTPTFTASVTPTWTFTSTPTQTRTPTNTPNPPPEFEFIVAVPTTFYCPALSPSSSQDSVVIFVKVQDPSGVSSVDLNYWLERKDNRARPDLVDNENVPMQYSPNWGGGSWWAEVTLTISSPSEGYWFQFRFKAKDYAGVTIQSEVIRDHVTYSCYFG